MLHQSYFADQETTQTARWTAWETRRKRVRSLMFTAREFHEEQG
jgi:hypothetical protein